MPTRHERGGVSFHTTAAFNRGADVSEFNPISWPTPHNTDYYKATNVCRCFKARKLLILVKQQANYSTRKELEPILQKESRKRPFSVQILVRIVAWRTFPIVRIQRIRATPAISRLHWKPFL